MIAYKLQQVAEILQVDARTVKKEIETGKLKAIKVCADWRVPEPNLVDYMNLVANNYKTTRELELEKENSQLKDKLAASEKLINTIKNELLKVAL